VGFSFGSTGGAIASGLHSDFSGGNEVQTWLKDYWYYQLSSNQWYREPDMAGVARAGATGFTINNTPYIGTGWDPNGTLMDFWYLGYYIF
jgi:hypothetical protein